MTDHLSHCGASDLDRLSERLRVMAANRMQAAQGLVLLARFDPASGDLGGAEDLINGANDLSFTADLLAEVAEQKRGATS